MRLDHDFRFGSADAEVDDDAILCFGSDKTVAAIATMTGLPTVGYGSHISIAVIDRIDHGTVGHIVADAFGLGQQGCLSTRAIVACNLSNVELAELCRGLIAETRNYWGNLLPMGLRLALDATYTQLRMSGATLAPRVDPNDLIIPIYDVQTTAEISEFISQSQFCLPVIAVPCPVANVESSLRLPAELTITTNLGNYEKIRDLSLKSPTICVSYIGQANRPLWDGRLHGHPLFLFNKVR
jgi:hypothetical protein